MVSPQSTPWIQVSRYSVQSAFWSYVPQWFPNAYLLNPFPRLAVDYDPVAHLNEIFTHPSTLASIPTTSQILRGHVDTLDTQINSLVARQSVADETSLERMIVVKAGLQDLFDRIEGVRGRAIATEDAITAMTADIKRLDATKRNLTLSMTALKRLQMLSMSLVNSETHYFQQIGFN